MNRNYCLAALALLMILFSCKKENFTPDTLILEPTPILTDDRTWGVVTEAYLKIVPEPGEVRDSVATLRRGEIVEIKATLKSDNEYWCRIVFQDLTGWVPRSSLNLYDVRSRAETGARMIRDKEK